MEKLDVVFRYVGHLMMVDNVVDANLQRFPVLRQAHESKRPSILYANMASILAELRFERQ